MAEAPRRKPRRTANACSACRLSKIKCSGDQPCANCLRRSLECVFTNPDHKIVVTESYLKELQDQATRQGSDQTQKARSSSPGSQCLTSRTFAPSGIVSDADGLEDAAADHLDSSIRSSESTVEAFAERGATRTNAEAGFDIAVNESLEVCMDPFSGPSKTVRNPLSDKREWIWLALWSTWSLTVRLSVLMADVLNDAGPATTVTVPQNAYTVTWEQFPASQSPDTSGLPSFDHATYLFNTAKFHLGQHYRFLGDADFLNQMTEFYFGDTQRQASENRLWYANFLLIMAFGIAFTSQSRISDEPPGKRYFVRAMTLIPSDDCVWKHSLLAIESLALAALYLYAIDNRESAVIKIGQAVRMAQMEGLHTCLPEKEIGRDVARRCRSLWESLWIVDRHISTSTGLPLTTPESGAASWILNVSSECHEDMVLRLQAKLSNLTWEILCTLYKNEPTALAVLLNNTRSILHSLADHAREIEELITISFGNLVPVMPKSTRHITLLYHRCVMIAIRPLLLLVLKERLENLRRGREYLSSFESFLTLTTSLLVTGIRSAEKTVEILSNHDSLLDPFLPFDIEFAHEAALYLLMARTLFPGALSGVDHVHLAYEFIDEMTFKGNKIAQCRKTELVRLDGFFSELIERSARIGLPTLKLLFTEGPTELTRPNSPSRVLQQSSNQSQNATILADPYTTIDLPIGAVDTEEGDTGIGCSLMENAGISSEAFLEIINQMSTQEDLLYDFAGFGS